MRILKYILPSVILLLFLAVGIKGFNTQTETAITEAASKNHALSRRDSILNSKSLPDSAVVYGINDFALSLAKVLRENTPDNYVVSPLGVAFNLSMISNGAAGQTREEIFKTLGVSECDDAQKSLNDFCEIIDAVLNANGKDGKSSLFNSFWIDEGHTVYDSFVKVCRDVFHTEVFVRELSSLATMREINNLVNSQTRGLIPEFLTEPLDVFQKSALLNTIYVKGAWDISFDPANTSPRYVFNNEDGSEGFCEMMHTTNEALQAMDFPGFKLIRFPIDSGKYAMDVVYTYEPCTVKDCFSYLNGRAIAHWRNSFMFGYGIIKMPKFDITVNHSFWASLKKLGIESLFKDGDFSRMTPNRNFFISDIIQEVKFIVDEKGAEAAAATMDTAVGSVFGESGPHEPTKLILDRPFMYLLTDTRTNTIIFIGEIRKF